MPDMKRICRLLFAAVLISCLLLSGCAGRKQDRKTAVVIDMHETAGTESAPEDSTSADWYGWWRMTKTGGDWARMYGYWWDCCAEVAADGSILIWDEDMPREDCLALLKTEQSDNAVTVIGGSFLDRTLDRNALKITLTEDKSGELMKISGRYDAVGKGGFDLEMYMRPWGAVWQADEDELPYYYTDWYLPLIEKGSSMPDRIGQ